MPFSILDPTAPLPPPAPITPGWGCHSLSLTLRRPYPLRPPLPQAGGAILYPWPYGAPTPSGPHYLRLGVPFSILDPTAPLPPPAPITSGWGCHSLSLTLRRPYPLRPPLVITSGYLCHSLSLTLRSTRKLFRLEPLPASGLTRHDVSEVTQVKTRWRRCHFHFHLFCLQHNVTSLCLSALTYLFQLLPYHFTVIKLFSSDGKFGFYDTLKSASPVSYARVSPVWWWCC